MIAAKGAMFNAKEQIQLTLESSQYAQPLAQRLSYERLGVICPYGILQAQEVYIQICLDYIKAISNHNIAAYKLYVALGNNL